MSEPRLSELAEACRRGDETAFAELYRTFADGVFHVANRILRNDEDATDALQETFLVAFRRFSTYRGEGSLKGWIYQVAVRIALRIRRRRRPTLSLDEEGVPPASQPGEPVPERDFRAAVQAEINHLPERARLVFVLHTAEGMTAESEITPRNLRECEAEAVALFCCAALDLPGAQEARGYIQAWWGQGHEIPERSAQRIMKVADQILKAGVRL